nr:MAG TPA: hypothetical protein [Caudoviricetes sp.]
MITKLHSQMFQIGFAKIHLMLCFLPQMVLVVMGLIQRNVLLFHQEKNHNLSEVCWSRH